MPPLAKERTILATGKEKNGPAAWSKTEIPIVECMMGAIVQVYKELSVWDGEDGRSHRATSEVRRQCTQKSA